MFQTLEKLSDSCRQCVKCKLSNTRKNVVISRGNPKAKLMLIGEGPGEQEDIQGLPFVGKAGQLLDLLLKAQKFPDDSYYIANIVKCRPPGNRVPDESEAMACLPYLRNQVAIIRPSIIVCMGGVAAKYIIDKGISITKARGRFIERNNFLIMPTFHPAALLRDDTKKEPMWNDFLLVKEKMQEDGYWS